MKKIISGLISGPMLPSGRSIMALLDLMLADFRADFWAYAAQLSINYGIARSNAGCSYANCTVCSTVFLV
jgi:hypothetical protein